MTWVGWRCLGCGHEMPPGGGGPRWCPKCQYTVYEPIQGSERKAAVEPERSSDGMSRRFELHRHVDPSGVSGTGVVADGVEFPGGVVVLRWRGRYPSVVVHERGLAAVEAIHGHDGATSIVLLDQ